MRAFSLFFVFIALVLLAQFLLFVSRGPLDTSFDTFVAGTLFVGFLLCLIPALYLLKPFESRDAFRRRREARRTRRERQAPEQDPPEGRS